jgi:hypothetical protein
MEYVVILERHRLVKEGIMNSRKTRIFLSLLCAAALCLVPSTASAIKVAVWADGSIPDGGNGADNSIDNAFGAGTATLVTSAQLATPGFLAAFDALVVTRFDAAFGAGLPAAAALQVESYVGATGNVVLFPGDWADNLFGSAVGDPFDANIDQLFINAVAFAAASGHGYVGEFNGAAMGLDANANGFDPLQFIAGGAGPLGAFPNGVDIVTPTPAGIGHPVLAGVTFPVANLDVTTFRTVMMGVPAGNILAEWADEVPAIVARGQIPEPSTLLFVGLGLVVVRGAASRRKRN